MTAPAITRPLSDAIGHALVAETMALLRADLRNAAADQHADALRTGSIEIALARFVGAIGGRDAEVALGRLLGWGRVHDFGALARASANGRAPAAPAPAAMEALLGLVECRNAVRQLAELQAELATQVSEWTPAQCDCLAELQHLVHVTGPQRWEAAVRLVVGGAA